MKKDSKRFQALLKIAIAIILLAVLITQLDLIQMFMILKKADLWLLIVALLVFISRNFLAAKRWQILLQANHINRSIFTLFRYYLIGAFFSIFLPSALGGDIPRAYYISRDSDDVVKAATTVLVERAIGLYAILVLAIIASSFVASIIDSTVFIWIGGITCVLVFMSTLLIFVDLNFFEQQPFAQIKVFRVLLNFVANVQKYRHQPKVLLGAFLMSVIYQFIAVVTTYLTAISIDEFFPFVYFMIIYPISWIASMIPVSLGGIGIREGTLVILFTYAGMSEESAGLISLLGLIFILAQGVLGLLPFLRAGKTTE
jgi:uncharacterized protein (TIRG00374 family)